MWQTLIAMLYPYVLNKYVELLAISYVSLKNLQNLTVLAQGICCQNGDCDNTMDQPEMVR